MRKELFREQELGQTLKGVECFFYSSQLFQTQDKLLSIHIKRCRTFFSKVKTSDTKIASSFLYSQ